jgi:hypothetical protein
VNSAITTDQALQNAAASVRMEGFELSDEIMKLCKEAMDGKISYSEYLSTLKERAEAGA